MKSIKFTRYIYIVHSPLDSFDADAEKMVDTSAVESSTIPPSLSHRMSKFIGLLVVNSLLAIKSS